MKNSVWFIIPCKNPTYDTSHEVKIKFQHQDEGNVWVAKICDEAMNDLSTFYGSGYYTLDHDKNIIIKEIEEQ